MPEVIIAGELLEWKGELKRSHENSVGAITLPIMIYYEKCFRFCSSKSLIGTDHFVSLLFEVYIRILLFIMIVSLAILRICMALWAESIAESIAIAIYPHLQFLTYIVSECTSYYHDNILPYRNQRAVLQSRSLDLSSMKTRGLISFWVNILLFFHHIHLCENCCFLYYYFSKNKFVKNIKFSITFQYQIYGISELRHIMGLARIMPFQFIIITWSMTFQFWQTWSFSTTMSCGSTQKMAFHDISGTRNSALSYTTLQQ